MSEVLQLDPASIIAENNVRSSLRQSDIDRMCESIQDVGGVQTPVTVRKEGKKYRLVFGFIRHAAIAKLNEQGAGLKLPAIVSDVEDDTAILKAQVAENVARATMSPIDTAQAIDRMVKAGISKTDIRKTFARPAGSKSKGLSPASNAWVNIHLNLLQLPKAIQKKIHEGAVSMAAAYELGKVPAEERDAVLERAEKAVQAQLDAEERDETRLLKTEKRQKEEKAKAEKLAADISEAEREAQAADTLVKSKLAAWKEARVAPYDPTDEAASKVAKEHIAASEKDYKEAQKLAKKAVNKLADLKTARSKAADKDIEPAAEKPAVAPKKAVVGPAAVKEAAKASGSGLKTLNISEARTAAKDISKANNPATAAIGSIFLRVLSGELSPKMAMGEIEAVCGGQPAGKKGKK